MPIKVTSKSVRNRANQILGVISRENAEEFLTGWANLPGAWPLRDEGKEMLTQHARSQTLLQTQYAKLLRDSGVTNVLMGDPEVTAIGHSWMREMLRRAWESSSNQREREWLCFRLRDTYAAMVRKRDMSVEERLKEELATDVFWPRYLAPPASPFEAALFYFQHQASRTRRCANTECAMPYFFVTKKGQRYCSLTCAVPAQKENKRRWWELNRGTRKGR